MKHVVIDSASATPMPAERDADAALSHALADELIGLTQMLSDLAYDLASEPDTLRRHMTSLQSIDLLTQTQIAIAETLRSAASVDDRLAAITLESLSDSLRRRIDPAGHSTWARSPAPTQPEIDHFD